MWRLSFHYHHYHQHYHYYHQHYHYYYRQHHFTFYYLYYRGSKRRIDKITSSSSSRCTNNYYKDRYYYLSIKSGDLRIVDDDYNYAFYYNG